MRIRFNILKYKKINIEQIFMHILFFKEIIFSTKKSSPVETALSLRRSILRIAINSPVEDFIWCREKERKKDKERKRELQFVGYASEKKKGTGRNFSADLSHVDGRDSGFYARRISRGTRERGVLLIFSFAEKNIRRAVRGNDWPIAQAGGEFIEYNFPRSLSDRAYARARRYQRRARHYGCVRAAWVISHARTGPTAPFEYLSESRRRRERRSKENIRTEEKKEALIRASKTGRVRRTRLDKPFKRGWKGAHECPWRSYSSDVPCGPSVTLWLTKRTSFSTMSRSQSVLNGYGDHCGQWCSCWK